MNKVGELVSAFLENKSRSEMLDFLNGILTPKEIEELSTRLQIVKMIKKGLPHQEIARRLEVGVATVTRGSRELRIGRFKKI
jgi:TrpR family trp operon transcriptional repressor